MERIKPHKGHYLFFLGNYGNNGGKEGRLWHNVGWKTHYMAIYFAEPLLHSNLLSGTIKIPLPHFIFIFKVLLQLCHNAMNLAL